MFLRSAAFDDACDGFDPAAGVDFVTHLLTTAEPQLKGTTPGPRWTWFDIAWVTRRAYEDETILNRMTYWVLGWSGASKDQPSWSRNVWIEFWVRRASAAVRAFDASVEFFEHVKRWASDVEHRILDLRGRAWTELERELVVQWLFRERTLRRLAMTVSHRGVPSDAVDDVIQSFWIAQGFNGLKGVLTTYVPQPGLPAAIRFVRFVDVALAREAVRFVAKTGGRAHQELSLDDDSDADTGGAPPQVAWTGLAVDEAMMDRERRDLIRSAIDRCLSELPPGERTALESLRRGRSPRETAKQMGISYGAAKLAAHRAKHRMRTLLSEEAQRNAAFAACLTPCQRR